MADGFRLAQKACPAFPAATVLAAYNAKVTTFQGRAIRWVAVRGAIPDPRQPAAFGVGGKLVTLMCSAYGVADTTDGSGLEVTAPIIFQLSRDGSRIVRFGVGLYEPGL